MEGIHDLGGLEGFGPVGHDETVFHDEWEARVFALVALARATNIDAFRHAIERLDPVTYLTAGYFGRWLGALELLIHEGDAPPPSDAPDPKREVPRQPRFAAGQPVRARELRTSGHTRLPGYVRGRRGRVERVHPAFVYPDTNAHGHGEDPQYVYCVRFEGDEVWGETAEAGTALHVDLFEPYLETAEDAA